MSKYTKEERAHVRKNVYAFKVSDSIGDYFILYWNGNAPFSWHAESKLGILYDNIIESDFVVQYYFCKKYAQENNLCFEECGKNDWKGILNSVRKVL